MQSRSFESIKEDVEKYLGKNLNDVEEAIESLY
jgi:hypothetical protein